MSENPQEELLVNRVLEFLTLKYPCSKYNKKGHITASAFIVDQKCNYCLLTNHKSLNKWIQLGGHIENDSSIIKAAKREAYEESSLKSLKLVTENIFDIDIHKIPNTDNTFHYHFDIRFLFMADKNEEFVVSKESLDLKWVSLKNLELYNCNNSLLKMREKLKL